MNNNYLIIGSGSIARKHATILRKIKKNINKIVFLSNNKKTDFINYCHKNKFDIVSNKINLKKENFSIIFICSPSTKHWYYFNYFKNNSDNFFIEKPIAHNYLEARKIINFSKKGKLIYIGYNLIFDEKFIYLKKLVLKNNFGKLFRVDCVTGQNLKFWRKETNYQKSVSANKNLVGGVLL